MSPLETLGFALGTSFASGLNLYATVAAAGLFQRLGIVNLPEPLQVLAHPVVLGVAITLFVVEFIADNLEYIVLAGVSAAVVPTAIEVFRRSRKAKRATTTVDPDVT